MNPPQTPPSTSRFKQLTRDQNILVHGLHEAGRNQTQIATQLGISRGQVSYSLRRGTVSPKKRKGPSSVLKADDVNQIISYIESSSENSRKTFLELAAGPFRYLGVSERVIQKELRKRGYRRHLAQIKPQGSSKTTTAHREWITRCPLSKTASKAK